MRPQSARDIIVAAYDAAEHGPWCDQLDRVMTLDERREVNELWELNA